MFSDAKLVVKSMIWAFKEVTGRFSYTPWQDDVALGKFSDTDAIEITSPQTAY